MSTPKPAPSAATTAPAPETASSSSDLFGSLHTDAGTARLPVRPAGSLAKSPSAPTRQLLSAFDALHISAFGEKALICGARDGKLLADLWKSHPHLVEPLMAEFFRERDPWVAGTMGFTVPGFRHRFGALLAKHAPRLRQASAEDWREECARTCKEPCPTWFIHDLRRP